MDALWSGFGQKDTASRSALRVHHAPQFPMEDLLDVFYPLFQSFYPSHHFYQMINKADYKFVIYDHEYRRCVAAALLSYHKKADGLYIELFGVRKSAQHLGLGTRLLRAITAWAYQYGFSFVDLHVHVENRKAIGLYHKAGFQEYEELPNFYRGSGKRNPNAYRMVLSFY